MQKSISSKEKENRIILLFSREDSCPKTVDVVEINVGRLSKASDSSVKRREFGGHARHRHVLHRAIRAGRLRAGSAASTKRRRGRDAASASAASDECTRIRGSKYAYYGSLPSRTCFRDRTLAGSYATQEVSVLDPFDLFRLIDIFLLLYFYAI